MDKKIFKNDIYLIFDKLLKTRNLKLEEFELLIENRDMILDEVYLSARAITKRFFNKQIYVRGLIEISNCCKNDCYYCGIRASNRDVNRYRLSREEILESVKLGTEIGFKTFVLQGGEDNGFKDEELMEIIREIKKINPETAITLSVGEKEFDVLEKYKLAGADRFLLRHETKNQEHYYKLHPKSMSQEHRLQALSNLKKLGFQTGSGIMVGSPGQTVSNIAEDLVYLSELNPEMVGIGPFIPAKGTPFENEESGSAELTVFLLCILRIMFPKANIPATTSLATLSKEWRDKAIEFAANVYMPNMTPTYRRKDYALYKDKACFKIEAAENLEELKSMFGKLGYCVVMNRGDFKDVQRKK